MTAVENEGGWYPIRNEETGPGVAVETNHERLPTNDPGMFEGTGVGFACC